MESNVVKVKLWNLDAGYLSWDQNAHVANFEYDPEFLTQNLDIAPLTMSIHSPRSQRQIPWPGNNDKLYQGLPPMVADSLPDKWGNSLFKAWLRDNQLSQKKVTPVDHLSFIGNRAMGALTYEPAHKLGDQKAFSVDVQRLYEFARQVLNEREATILNQENSVLWQDLIKISSSPGGKRPKAIVALNEKTGKIISGQGKIPEDYQHFILKYDDNSAYPFGKLEYIYYRMALNAGIKMMPSQLKTFGNITHFLTRRFDRVHNERIHIQTLAAMDPNSNSYEDIFSVIRKLKLPYEDLEQQYIRMVFNVLARNVDDHSKNFAFCMHKDGSWKLSPAYDLTFSVDLAAPAYVNRHSLSVNGKYEQITREDLEIIGQNNDIQNYKSLIDKVGNAISGFDTYAREEKLNPGLIDDIRKEFIEI